jgi:hypothetical protein
LLNHYIDTMAAQGTPMSLDQIEAFEHKNVITRALGVSEKVEVDVARVELQRDDTLLLCSNGLSDALSDHVICATMLEAASPADICSLLRGKALEAGAPDNLAIVAVRVKGERLPPRQLGPLVHAPFAPPSADGRKLEHDQELRSRTTPLEHRWALADSGSLAVTDAAELPDGRLLVALGELGAVLVARSGKVSARFSEPAHRIVLSDHGDRALLLARRGEAYRVSRLDLLAKRIQPWCDARFDQFADGFDGSTWFVSSRGTLYAIDATADGWEQTWSISEAHTMFSSIRRNSVRVSAWLRTSDDRDQVWTIELPSLTLRLRAPIDAGEASLENGAVSASGEFAGLCIATGGECKLRALQHGAWTESPLAISTLPMQPLFDGGWLALPLVGRDSTVLHVLDASALEERARLEFAGAGPSIGARIQGEHLLAWDGLGRVVVLSLVTGNVLNEWRIS